MIKNFVLNFNIMNYKFSNEVHPSTTSHIEFLRHFGNFCLPKNTSKKLFLRVTPILVAPKHHTPSKLSEKRKICDFCLPVVEITINEDFSSRKRIFSCKLKIMARETFDMSKKKYFSKQISRINFWQALCVPNMQKRGPEFSKKFRIKCKILWAKP